MSRTPPISSRRKSSSRPLRSWPEQIIGGKYIRSLENHLRSLRSAGHGNQKLHLDDVFVSYLLAFYNPTLRTLRTLEDFSQTRQAQQHIAVKRIPRSTLSDFNRLADPQRLKPIIHHLVAAIPRWHKSPDLPDRLQRILAVDGSFFAGAADIAWAVRHRTNQGQCKSSVRLDVTMDVHRWVPEIVQVSGSETSEAEEAQRHVQPGAIHIYDRGIFSFDLINALVQSKSEFVMRRREEGGRCPRFLSEEEQSLSDEAQAAGVQSDCLGRLAGSTHRTPPNTTLREIVIDSPDQPGGQVRLLTNIVDLDAAVIGQIYRWRWQIELFFRWLKVYAQFDHLISHSRAGVELSFYVAVIGILLMLLHIEAKPSKYAVNLLQMVAMGSANLEEIAPILAERQRQIEVAKASRARRKAAAAAQ